MLGVPWLTCLSLESGSITNYGISCLQRSVFNSPSYLIANSITRLSLSSNPLDVKSVEKLCSILNTNTSIVDLNLVGCEINDEGGLRIATMLHSNFTLTRMRLSNNLISDQAVLGSLLMAVDSNPVISIELSTSCFSTLLNFEKQRFAFVCVCVCVCVCVFE